MDDHRRRIGLVLGGGGGKGAAHIGVLSALAALRVPVDIMVGTSIGGLVAALYAVGYRPLEIEQWFGRAKRRTILERDLSASGFLGTRKIEALLREALGTRTFADAQLPLAMVAVDIVRGEEVVLRDGPLVDAVLATSAVPGLFPPLVRDEQLLVDGGVLNNVPVDVAIGMGAGRTIGVDLGQLSRSFRPAALTAPAGSQALRLPAWSPRRLLPRSPLQIAERALAIMMSQRTEQRLRETPPTVLLRPGVAALLPFDFGQTLQGRMAGERAAFEERERLEQLRAWRNGNNET